MIRFRSDNSHAIGNLIGWLPIGLVVFGWAAAGVLAADDADQGDRAVRQAASGSADHSDVTRSGSAPPSAAVSQASHVAPHAERLLLQIDGQWLLIELRIKVEGESVDEAWIGGLRSRLKKWDQDADGRLSRDEVEAARAELLAGPPTRLRDTLAHPDVFQADRSPRDERLSVTELRDWLRAQQSGEMQVHESPTGQLLAAAASQVSVADELLYSLVDRDANGSLSESEWQRFTAGALHCDLNGDGVLTIREVLSERGSLQGRAPPEPLADDPVSLWRLTDQRGIRAAAGRLLEPHRSDAERDAESSGEEQADPATRWTGLLKQWQPTWPQAARFDWDQTGSLDHMELQSLLARAEPHVVLEASLKERSVGAIRVVKSRLPASSAERDETPPPAHAGTEQAPDRAVLSISSVGNRAIRLAGPRTEWQWIVADAPRSVQAQVVAMMEQADRDTNGYVDQEESGRIEEYKSIFRNADANDDAMVFPDELTEWLEPQYADAKSSIRMTVRNVGPSLFAVVDLDQDQRLELRERRMVSRLLPGWDADEDHGLDRSELPSVLRIVIGLGLPETISVSERLASGTSTAKDRHVAAGPVWFDRLDQNRDEDLQLTEFAGPVELFRRWDEDGDGLISRQEAYRAEQE